MQRDLIIEEEGIFYRAFFIGNGLVILEELEMLFLSYFDIFNDGVQILMQVFLDQFGITKVKHEPQISLLFEINVCNKYICCPVINCNIIIVSLNSISS